MGCEHVGTAGHCGESEMIVLECLLCAGCFVNLILSSAPRGRSPWHREDEMGLRKMTEVVMIQNKSVAELWGGLRGSNSKPQAQPPGSLAAGTPVLKLTDLGEFAHTRPGPRMALAAFSMATNLLSTLGLSPDFSVPDLPEDGISFSLSASGSVTVCQSLGCRRPMSSSTHILS